jgi:hypothetical protein
MRAFTGVQAGDLRDISAKLCGTVALLENDFNKIGTLPFIPLFCEVNLKSKI